MAPLWQLFSASFGRDGDDAGLLWWVLPPGAAFRALQRRLFLLCDAHSSASHCNRMQCRLVQSDGTVPRAIHFAARASHGEHARYCEHTSSQAAKEQNIRST
jgi:hypothetical protein